MAQAKLSDVLGSSFDTLITLNAGTAVTVKETVGLVVDTVRGVRKPNKNAWDAVGNYSEVLVIDSRKSLRAAKFEETISDKAYELLEKDKAYIASEVERIRKELEGDSSEISF